MTLPDVSVETIDDRTTSDPTTATDQYFVVAAFLQGPTTPTRISSKEKLAKAFGVPANYTAGPDDAELYLREGGKNLIIKRVVGPAPVKATHDFLTAGATVSLTISAVDYGAYGNAITVAVTAGGAGNFIITVADASGTLEQSPELADQAAAVAWGANATYVDVAVGAGSGDPAVVAATALAGGTDDHASITDANYATALATLDKRLGPGQVSMPGRTTMASHDVLDAHCVAFDRIPLKHLVDTTVAGTLVTAVAADHTKEGAKRSGVFAGWLVAPDNRIIPPTGFVAAKMAIVDLETGNPNLPAAGERGKARWVIDATADFNDTDRETLNDVGINVIHDVTGLGDLQIYGYRTLVNEASDPINIGLNNARLDMFIRWSARKFGRSLLFEQIDGKGHLVSRYHVLLEAFMKDLFDDGAVYSYIVDTESVNDAETAAAKTLNARIHVQRSPFAERVVLEVINHAVSEEL